MNATLRGEIQALRKSADAASKKMKTLREQLEAINSSVSDVQTGVSGWITSFESQLTEIWKADFLEKKTFHLLPDSGENSLAGIADWYANMKTFAEEQFTAITEEPGWAGTFALFWLDAAKSETLTIKNQDFEPPPLWRCWPSGRPGRRAEPGRDAGRIS